MAFRGGFSRGRRIEGEGWRWRRAGQQPLGAQHHRRRTSLEEKDKGKERDMGREVRQQAAWPEYSESHHLRWLQYSDQSLQKESSPRNACLSFMSLYLRRPRQQKAGTKSPRVSTKETYDEVCAGERAPEVVPGAPAPCSTHPTLSPSFPISSRPFSRAPRESLPSCGTGLEV